MVCTLHVTYETRSMYWQSSENVPLPTVQACMILQFINWDYLFDAWEKDRIKCNRSDMFNVEVKMLFKDKESSYSFWVSPSCFSCDSSSVFAVKESIDLKIMSGLGQMQDFLYQAENTYFTYNASCVFRGFLTSPLLNSPSLSRSMLYHRLLSAAAKLTNERSALQDKCFFVQSYFKWRQMTVCVWERGVRE